jgi:hypothetical protein
MKIITLESTMFEVSNDIYFIVYNLYYVDQNDDLGIRARPINWDGGSIFYVCVCFNKLFV